MSVRVWGTSLEWRTRTKREAEFSDLPGRRNQSKRSKRSRSQGEKATLNIKTGANRPRIRETGERCKCRHIFTPWPVEHAVQRQGYHCLERNTPIVAAVIEGMSMSLILDTGSNISLMNERVTYENSNLDLQLHNNRFCGNATAFLSKKVLLKLSQYEICKSRHTSLSHFNTTGTPTVLCNV
jgi:hypothetical protein